MEEEIREAFDFSFVLLTHLYATTITHRELENAKEIWDWKAQRFIDEFRLRHRLFEEELQSDDVVVSYDLQEVHAFLKTVNISPNMKVEKWGLQVHNPDLRPLQTVQKERENSEMVKKTFIELIPKFNYDQKAAFNTVSGTVFLRLTSEAIKIENRDINLNDYEDLEITAQTKVPDTF